MRTFQLNLTRLFLLQLLIAPAFLGPLYYDMPWQSRPNVMLFALLLAPVSYVSVFCYRALASSIAQPSHSKHSFVFRAIRSGVLFGLLFGMLMICSLSALWCRDVFSADLRWSLNMTLINAAIVGPFILLHYLLIGAATGGLVGMVMDVLSRSRFSPASDNQNPAP